VPGIEAGVSGSVARNADHWTTDAAIALKIYKIYSYLKKLQN
jgi:hypothetical protein